MSKKFFLPPHCINEVAMTLTDGQSMAWNTQMLNIPEIHSLYAITGEDVTVGMIDTGVYNHPDLKFEKILNATNESYDPTNHRSLNGHGVGVAGVIAAKNNNLGFLSVAPDCKLVAVKGMRENGTGMMKEIVKAMYMCAENGCSFINMSLGTPSKSHDLYMAVRELRDKGILIVAASGNSGRVGGKNEVNYPARYEETIAVAAINQNKKVSSFSSKGWEVEIAAPGEHIMTTWLNNSYSALSGTSFAAPHVTGILALLKQAGVAVSAKLLSDTAMDIEDVARDIKTGYGLINPYQIVYRTNQKPQVSPSAQITITSAIDFAQAVEAYNKIGNFLRTNKVI